MVLSGMRPVLPETNELKVDSKAEMADGAQPSASIFVCEEDEGEDGLEDGDDDDRPQEDDGRNE